MMISLCACKVREAFAPADLVRAAFTEISPLPLPSAAVPVVCKITLVPAFNRLLMSVLSTLVAPLPELHVLLTLATVLVVALTVRSHGSSNHVPAIPLGAAASILTPAISSQCAEV